VSWIEAKNGDLILREGDASDSVLVIVYGRLRTVARKKKGRKAFGINTSTAVEFSGGMGIGAATCGPYQLNSDETHGSASWREFGSVASNLSSLGVEATSSATDGVQSRSRASTEHLNLLAEHDDKPKEFGFGNVVGAQEFLAGTRHRRSVCAIRNSQLARIPASVFHHTARKIPHVWSHFCRYVFGLSGGATERRSVLTVAVVPIVKDVPIDYFCDKLHAGLEIIGKTTVLDGGEATLTKAAQTPSSTPTGSPLPSRQSARRSDDRSFRKIVAHVQRHHENLSRRLSQLEQQNKHLIFKIRQPLEHRRWTRAAVGNADIVIVVGMFKWSFFIVRSQFPLQSQSYSC